MSHDTCFDVERGVEGRSARFRGGNLRKQIRMASFSWETGSASRVWVKKMKHRLVRWDGRIRVASPSGRDELPARAGAGVYNAYNSNRLLLLRDRFPRLYNDSIPEPLRAAS